MNLFESEIDHQSIDTKEVTKPLKRDSFLGEIIDLRKQLIRRVRASATPSKYDEFYAALRLSTHVLGDPSRFDDDEIKNIRQKLLKILS